MWLVRFVNTPSVLPTVIDATIINQSLGIIVAIVVRIRVSIGSILIIDQNIANIREQKSNCILTV